MSAIEDFRSITSFSVNHSQDLVKRSWKVLSHTIYANWGSLMVGDKILDEVHQYEKKSFVEISFEKVYDHSGFGFFGDGLAIIGELGL